jgi:hypothetical protein
VGEEESLVFTIRRIVQRSRSAEEHGRGHWLPRLSTQGSGFIIMFTNLPMT